jgi:hypothetical protein
MATDFDVTTYPLETSTAFNHGLGTRLDRMDDGTVHSRTISSQKPVRINCAFNPQTDTSSEAFLQYLYDNAATEFNVTHNGKTFTGYLDGESVQEGITDGTLHWWTFAIEGNAV